MMDFFEARAEQRKFRHIAEEIEKEAIQTDCPVYRGDREIDLYVKLSDVIKILEDNSPMEFPLLDKCYNSNSDEPCRRCIPKEIVDKIEQRNALKKEIYAWCMENLDIDGMDPDNADITDYYTGEEQGDDGCDEWCDQTQLGDDWFIGEYYWETEYEGKYLHMTFNCLKERKNRMSKELEKARELVRMLEEKEYENKVVLSSLNPGETFKIGEHDFIVLNQGEGCTEVISKEFMAEDKVFDSNTRNYANSSLKKLIEKEIQHVIEENIGADNIIEHSVDLTSIDNQHEFDKCKCKVRPITFDEVRKYNDLLVNEDLGDWWWTCTPWSTKWREWPYSIAAVSPLGFISFNRCDCARGVRPFCILKSNIFVPNGV